MTTYSSFQEIGQTPATYAAGTEVFIEPSGTAIAASATDVTEDNVISMDSNSGSLTANSCILISGGATNATASSSSAMHLNSVTWNISSDAATFQQWVFPTFFDNVDIHFTGTGTLFGIFGNGSGTNFPTFDDNWNITTEGDGAKARGRPWQWNNVRIFGNGTGTQAILNGVIPDNDAEGNPLSFFNNVDFYPSPSTIARLRRGAFGELPFVPFANANWGPFTRTAENGLYIARQTGGMRRTELSITGNWLIQPQWNCAGVAVDSQIGIDANCFVFYPNITPSTTNTVSFRGWSNNAATRAANGTTGPARAINCVSWNPNIITPPGATQDFRLVYQDIPGVTTQVFSVPQMPFNNATVPTAFTSGDLVDNTFNGLFVVHQDILLTGDSTSSTNFPITTPTARDIHIFSYANQFDTVAGDDVTRQFGEPIPVGPARFNPINADLSYTSTDNLDFPVDPFLNGVALADTADTNAVSNTDNIYPELKGLAYNNREVENLRLPVIMTENSFRFIGGALEFVTLPSTINSTTGATLLNTADNLSVGSVNTFIFRNEAGSQILPVTWRTDMTFDGPITIQGGTHINLPITFPNGLTIGQGDFNILNTNAITVDWSGVTIPANATVTITTFADFRIEGLSQADFDRIVNSPSSTGQVIRVPPTANYVFTTGALDGRYALQRVRSGVGTIIASGDITGGTPFTISIRSSTTTPGDVYNLYYKPTNDPTVRGYETAVATTGPVSTSLASDVNVSAMALPIPSALFETDVYPGASLSATNPVVAVGGDNPGIQVSITGATAMGNDLNGRISQNLLLRATDDANYFAQMVQLQRTQDFIRPDVRSTIIDDVTLTTGNGPTQTQQQLQSITLEGSSGVATITVIDITVPAVIIHPNPEGLTDGDILDAINSSRLSQGVGYILGQGSDTSLIGISPRETDYDKTSTTYSDNL